jgi:hypothetical protein
MRFNFKKITAIATSALMVGMTMGVAAATNYPAPFVSGGTANVAVVYGTGEGVSALDQTQAYNINLNLQSFMGDSDGDTGDVVTGGDSVLLAKASDNLNLANTWQVFGTTVTDDYLPELLADGTYTAKDNDDFDYEQKITLGAPALTNFRDSDYESLVGLTERTPTIGFQIASNTAVMNYTLEFTEDPTSDVTSSDLEDFEGSDLPLLGRTYYVSDFKNGTSATYLGALTLLDSANTATVKEGETITLTVGDKSYEVSIDFVDSDSAALNIDGVVTDDLAEGSTQKLSDGAYVGIRDVRKLEVSGELGSVEFSIGSGKLEITSGSEVKKNDDAIQGVYGYVYQATPSGNAEKIDKIVIEWKTDDEVFLTSELELIMPGFEAVKFSMADFVRPTEEKVSIEKDSDTSIELTVPIKDGTVSLNILYSNASGEFEGTGKASDERLATANGTGTDASIIFKEKSSGTNYHSYFVASYAATQEAESYLLRAKVAYDSTADRNETTLEKYDGSAWTEVCGDKVSGDTCNVGKVSLTIGTVAYTAGGTESVNITGTSGVSLNHIFTKGGLKIYLPFETAVNVSSTSLGAINFSTGQAVTAANDGHDSDTFWLFMDGEDKDDTIAGGALFNFTFDDTSNGRLQVSEVNHAGSGGSGALEVGDSTNIYEKYIIDDVAPRIIHYTKPDEDYAEVYYPTGDSESYAKVYLADQLATITAGTSSGGSSTQLGNVVYMDSEKSSWVSKNVIIIGGSCINSAAAEALGVSSKTCAEAFTEATSVSAGQFLIQSVGDAFTEGKIALVVAGYNVDDTVKAASYLTTQTVDTTAGTKVVKSSATYETIV